MKKDKEKIEEEINENNATQEFVVPRSIPITFAIIISSYFD